MITITLAMVAAVHAPPEPGQIVLFLFGAVASFAAVETIATRAFRRGLAEREASAVIALGSSISLVSIALAVGVAGLVALAMPETVGWLVSAFVASITYLLVSAAEMTLARRIEERRDARITRRT